MDELTERLKRELKQASDSLTELSECVPPIEVAKTAKLMAAYIFGDEETRQRIEADLEKAQKAYENQL